MENIDAIIDLLNSENREDFELGVNMIEALEERPVINLKALNEDFEYDIREGRLKRRRVSLKFNEGRSTWTYHYPYGSFNNREWEED